LPYPREGFFWNYPGFPSLFVAYGETPDFWWSGHIGILMIMFLEFRSAGWYRFSIYNICTLVYTFWMMIVSRDHYTIDMISGFIIGHYLWIMFDKYSYIFDYNVLGTPLHKRLSTPE